MMVAFTLKTPATTEPVEVEDAKAHARITHAYDDGLIQGYITAARQWVEAYTQRSLVTQTWQMSMPYFAPNVWLPRAAPLQSITHVKYYNDSNSLTTWTSTNYTTPAFHEPALLQTVAGVSWPSVYDRQDAVQVEYITGYEDGECPEALRLAVLTLVAHYCENREALLVGTMSKEVEFSVTALAAPYRVWWREPEW